MTTTPMPPIVPPDDDPDGRTEDSAEADRDASYGETPDAAEEGADRETSADADYEASMEQRPETD